MKLALTLGLIALPLLPSCQAVEGTGRKQLNF